MSTEHDPEIHAWMQMMAEANPVAATTLATARTMWPGESLVLLVVGGAAEGQPIGTFAEFYVRFGGIEGPSLPPHGPWMVALPQHKAFTVCAALAAMECAPPGWAELSSCPPVPGVWVILSRLGQELVGLRTDSGDLGLPTKCPACRSVAHVESPTLARLRGPKRSRPS